MAQVTKKQLQPPKHPNSAKSDSPKMPDGVYESSYIPGLELLDYSLLNQPVDTGRVGLAALVDCLKYGTAEVRDYLLNECKLIINCRACDSFFRGICNYVAHKRNFCKEHVCENMVLFDPSWFSYENVEKNDVGVQTCDPPTDEAPAKPVFTHSPRKMLHPRRAILDPTENLFSSTSPSPPSAQKRKRLNDIVGGIRIYQQSPAENITPRYSSPLATTSLSSSNATGVYNTATTSAASSSPSPSTSNVHSSPLPPAKKQKLIRMKKRQKSSNYGKPLYHEGDYEQLMVELLEEIRQNLRVQPGPLKVSPDRQLLSLVSLNRMYSCQSNFQFECPHCHDTCRYFVSAIRHLIRKHAYKAKQSKAKWVSFLYGRPLKATQKPVNWLEIVEDGQPTAFKGLTLQGEEDVDEKQKIVKQDRAHSQTEPRPSETNEPIKEESEEQKSSTVAFEQSGVRSPLEAGTSGTNESFVVIKERLEQFISQKEQQKLTKASTSQDSTDPPFPANEFEHLSKCIDYYFTCPNCLETDFLSTSFAVAVNHLISAHKVPRPHAVWIAVESAQALKVEEPSFNGFFNGNQIRATNDPAKPPTGVQRQRSRKTTPHRQPQTPARAPPPLFESTFNGHNQQDVEQISNDEIEVITLSSDSENDVEVEEVAFEPADTEQQNGFQDADDLDELPLQNGFGDSDDSEELPNQNGFSDHSNGSHYLNRDQHLRRRESLSSYIQSFVEIDEWNAHCRSCFQPGPDSIFENEPSLCGRIASFVVDEHFCSKCPNVPFLNKVDLEQHITLSHLNTLLVVCLICKRYSTAHPGMMRRHLFGHDPSLDFGLLDIVNSIDNTIRFVDESAVEENGASPNLMNDI